MGDDDEWHDATYYRNGNGKLYSLVGVAMAGPFSQLTPVKVREKHVKLWPHAIMMRAGLIGEDVELFNVGDIVNGMQVVRIDDGGGFIVLQPPPTTHVVFVPCCEAGA